MGLEQLLENPERAPFYDLLGGLADNLITIGGHAGTFLSCAKCGETFTLKDRSWTCESCGESFELKFEPARHSGTPFKTRVAATGLTKPRVNPHWYFEDENWSVAEFLTQLLRLPPEDFLPKWFTKLGFSLGPFKLESVFCWPPFRFGDKTIQPDLAVSWEQDIVFVEFKRPRGGRTPPTEIMGQLCFAAQASHQLGRRFHLMLVPGPDSVVHDAEAYIRKAMAAAEKAQIKWQIRPSLLAEIQSSSVTELCGRFRVYGWESLIRLSADVIRESVPDSWTRRQVLAKLLYFHQQRAALNLLSSPEWT